MLPGVCLLFHRWHVHVHVADKVLQVLALNDQHRLSEGLEVQPQQCHDDVQLCNATNVNADLVKGSRRAEIFEGCYVEGALHLKTQMGILGTCPAHHDAQETASGVCSEGCEVVPPPQWGLWPSRSLPFAHFKCKDRPAYGTAAEVTSECLVVSLLNTSCTQALCSEHVQNRIIKHNKQGSNPVYC